MRQAGLSLLMAFLCTRAITFAQVETEHLRGTVTTVSGTAITIRTTTNQTRTITIDVKTMIMRGDAHVTIKDVKVGDRVVLDVDTKTSVAAPTEAHQHEQMQMAGPGWQYMQDGILFGTFNRQGSPRGDKEFIAQNWYMGMLSRQAGKGTLTLSGMFSLDPATVGKSGYSEIFQVGEALGGRPLIDRQHPHDLVMQLAAVWRIPLNDTTGVTIAGGPAGEPALGPVAFMHRPSAAENSTAPLGHHTFDSTHISYGVITAAVDHGPWIVEGSLFNGREPDEDRWDFDFGALDSVSGRVWYRPSDEWEFQASTGFLKHPEELEPGNVVRTTFSGSWFRRHETDFTAVTAGYGWNHEDEGNHGSFFTEATWHAGMSSVYGRVEAQQPEIAALLTGGSVDTPEARSLRATVLALTVGGVRDVVHARGFQLGLGGDFTVYGVPDVLQTGRGFCGTRSCALGAGYGSSPVSFHIFFRLRPPAAMGRMWNMRMSQPMLGHQMGVMDHK
jgi:guanyl-specific ribonuclease Sa